jgi:hypothetical protein
MVIGSCVRAPRRGINDPVALAIGTLTTIMPEGTCGEPDAGTTRTSGSGGRHEETGQE